jgi:hypothetical protein
MRSPGQALVYLQLIYRCSQIAYALQVGGLAVLFPVDSPTKTMESPRRGNRFGGLLVGSNSLEVLVLNRVGVRVPLAHKLRNRSSGSNAACSFSADNANSAGGGTSTA